jgi:malonyl-CoA/methylmalonyl-CoA synthetase
MSIELIDRATRHAGRVAIVDAAGEYAYDDLLGGSDLVARTLLAGRPDLGEARVAFMVAPGFDYVATLCGIWRAGGIAVPLSPSHPAPELEYVLDDTAAEAVVGDMASELRLKPLAAARDMWFVQSTEAIEGSGEGSPLAPHPSPLDVDESRRALILYTSGTTGRPKGVVLTHANLRAQMESLVEAWDWSTDDRILHVLPLHHTHGLVNALLCALWAGAACEMLPGFDAPRVWQRLVERGPTLFMAVPTIYAKLIAEWENADPDERKRRSQSCHALRLMVSGSAALPGSVFERWREISGHALLERYGMTEIGMALSNPLHGERRPGTVGHPLPGVGVRLLDEAGLPVARESLPGEIYVRGPGVFKEYWGRPDETRNAFRAGWFCTGDIAVVDGGYYRILGRNNVDIIKTGGYKVSALEIEEALRGHPGIQDCAVVGVEDPEWGERVSAAVVASGDTPTAESLRAWLAERIAPYKVPRRWLFVDALPRNAMGKVTKAAIRQLFDS